RGGGWLLASRPGVGRLDGGRQRGRGVGAGGHPVPDYPGPAAVGRRGAPLVRVTSRRGFTLPELLLVVVLLLVVLGTVAAVVQRQQRFYSAVTRIIDQRSQLRDALDLLPGDLRGASSAGGDFLVLSDSAVELRAPIGTGIVCDTAAGR